MAAADYFLVVPVRGAKSPGRVKKNWWLITFVSLALMAVVVLVVNARPRSWLITPGG